VISDGVEKREIQIGARNYSILMPPPTKGMPIVSRASVTLAPIITGLTALQGGNIDVLMVLLAKVDPNSFNDLLMLTVEATKLTVDGVPICTQVTFDKHFAGCREDIYPVCLWSLLEVIGPFFPMLAAFSQGVRQKLTE
jgi:hypothetical protein